MFISAIQIRDLGQDMVEQQTRRLRDAIDGTWTRLETTLPQEGTGNTVSRRQASELIDRCIETCTANRIFDRQIIAEFSLLVLTAVQRGHGANFVNGIGVYFAEERLHPRKALEWIADVLTGCHVLEHEESV